MRTAIVALFLLYGCSTESPLPSCTTATYDLGTSPDLSKSESCGKNGEPCCVEDCEAGLTCLALGTDGNRCGGLQPGRHCRYLDNCGTKDTSCCESQGLVAAAFQEGYCRSGFACQIVSGMGRVCEPLCD